MFSSLIQWLKSLFTLPAIAISNLENPKYIDYSNDYIAPVPGMADDSWLYCFPIKGDFGKMQALVDQRLNFSPLSKKVKFFALSEYMILVLSDIKKGYSIDPTYTKYGYLEEKALQIFMPIVECTLNNDNTWVAQRILVFIPHIYVDQPINVSIGREIFGFPKAFASISLPDLPAEANEFNVKAYGFKNFNKEAPEYGGFHEILSIKKINSSETSGQWTSHHEAWQHIKQFVPTHHASNFDWGVPLVLHELNDIDHKTIPMAFLKQFRDINKPLNASYQAITIGNGYTDDFLDGWLLGGEYEITFTDMASFPIAEDLGLETTILVKHAFWIHANLRFDTGDVIWKSN